MLVLRLAGLEDVAGGQTAPEGRMIGASGVAADEFASLTAESILAGGSERSSAGALTDVLAGLSDAADTVAILFPVWDSGRAVDALHVPAITGLRGLHVGARDDRSAEVAMG